jgi:peroxiredoxin
MVYVAEAHAGGDWKSTINEREGIALSPAKSDGEKREYAASCARKLHIEYPLAADGLDRKVEHAYHAWPSAVYLIDRDGRIAWSSRLGELDFHPEEMEKAIKSLLK